MTEMKFPGRWVVPVVFALFLPGCGDYRDARTGFAVRDSAGVAIATSTKGAWQEGEQWAFSESPSLVIGAAASGEPLWRIWDCERAPDGRIVLLSRGPPTVLVYDAGGTHIASLGQEGQGPGEFESPRDIALAPPDTVLVLDRDAIEVYLLDGTFLGSESLRDRDYSIPDVGRATPTSLAPNRSILARVLVPRAGPPVGMQRPDQYLAVLPPGGESPVLLGSYPALEQQRLPGDMGGNVVPPYARDSRWAVGTSPDAQFLAADQDRYEISVFNARGALRRVIRRDYEPIAVRDSWVEDWKEEQRGTPWVARRPAAHERAWTQMPIHEYVQALDMIAADTAGNIWVLRPNPEGDPFFDVFGPEGRFLGKVGVPSGYAESRRPWIGTSHFMGVWTDSLGVETVRLYELTGRS